MRRSRISCAAPRRGAPDSCWSSPAKARGQAGRGRGVLRRQVPLWLGLAEFRDAVLGFEEAHMAHGGEGALYVRLRRTR